MTVGRDRTEVLEETSLLFAVLFLGTNPVAVKYAIGEMPALPFVALRFTIAGLLLLLVLRLLDRERAPKVRDLLLMAPVGVVGVGLNNSLFTLGVGMTTASETALIYATPPLWGMLLGFMLGLERPRPRGVLGVLVALLGVGVVVYGGSSLKGPSLLGDLLVMGGAICWGSYTVLALGLLRRYSPLAVAASTMFFGGLAVLPIAAFTGLSSTDWGAVSTKAWVAFAYSALAVGAYGFLAWQRGVSRLGANRVLVYQYLVTLIGVVAGVLVLGEDLTVNKVLGGAVILVGVYLSRRQ